MRKVTTTLNKVKRSSAPSETTQVKAVNLAYYKALSARDLRAMEAVWTCAADNILIDRRSIRIRT
jgi:hypothetical protein